MRKTVVGVVCCAFALGLPPLAADSAPPPASRSTPKAEDSGWVFELLPKSMQKNPRLDVTVLTELTEEGRKRPAVDTAHPAYYVLHTGGYQPRNGEPPGEELLPAAAIDEFVRQSLASAGFVPASGAPEQRASLALAYVWGTHGEPLDSEALSPQESAKNLRERAALVGGEKFAREVMELLRRSYEMRASASSGMALEVNGEAAPPPPQAVLHAFMNPIERFRSASPHNAFLLEQVRGDIYFVVVSAYDYDALAAGKRVLLWRTRMTAGAAGIAQATALPGLVRAAAAFYGKEMTEVATVTPRALREGKTTYGPLEVKDWEPDLKKLQEKR